MCSPVGFSDGLISVFQVKISQITIDYDKLPQLFQVSKFLYIFFKFLTDFVDWKFEKGQQGKKVLSSRLLRSVFLVFKWNCLKLTPKMTKISKFSKSQRFYAFFSNFWQTLWIGTLEKVNNVEMCYPVGYSEEFIAVFLVKMSLIKTKNDEKQKLFPILNVFFAFSVKISTDFVDWNVLRG